MNPKEFYFPFDFFLIFNFGALWTETKYKGFLFQNVNTHIQSLSSVQNAVPHASHLVLQVWRFLSHYNLQWATPMGEQKSFLHTKGQEHHAQTHSGIQDTLENCF